MLVQTKRVAMVSQEANEEALRLNLILAEEKRDLASIRLVHSKHKMSKYYNMRIRPVTFKPSDHVLRRNEKSKAPSQGKLCPNWEGPYDITQANDNESYLLAMHDGD